MTLFEALTGGAFDRLNWQHSGEFDQNFSKSQMPGGLPGGGMGGFGIDRYITSDNIGKPFYRGYVIGHKMLSLKLSKE